MGSNPILSISQVLNTIMQVATNIDEWHALLSPENVMTKQEIETEIQILAKNKKISLKEAKKLYMKKFEESWRRM